MSMPSSSSSFKLPNVPDSVYENPVPRDSGARQLRSSSTSVSAYILPPSPVHSAISHAMTPEIRQQIYNFSSSGALPMVGKVEDVILATLKEVFRDKKNEHVAPFITVSKACFRVLNGSGTLIPEHDQNCIELHEEGDFGSSEYRITVLDHRFSAMHTHLGDATTQKLQSLFSKSDELLFSFLKESKQKIDLPRIQNLTKELNESPISQLNVPLNIGADIRRLRSTVGFLVRTLSCYEKAAQESPYLSSIKTIVSETFDISVTSSDNVDNSKIYNLVAEYVPEIEIEYDIIFAKQLLQKLAGPKTNSIWSCFQFCCG